MRPPPPVPLTSPSPPLPQIRRQTHGGGVVCLMPFCSFSLALWTDRTGFLLPNVKRLTRTRLKGGSGSEHTTLQGVYRSADWLGSCCFFVPLYFRNPWLCWWLYRSLSHKLSSSTDFVTLNFPTLPGFSRESKGGGDPAFSEEAEPGRNLTSSLKKNENYLFVCLFVWNIFYSSKRAAVKM